MSFYAYIDDKDFKKFIEDNEINIFSNELHKLMKNITIQSIIIFISNIKNLEFVKKYFNDDKLKNIEPQYLHYLAILIMEHLSIKEKKVDSPIFYGKKLSKNKKNLLKENVVSKTISEENKMNLSDYKYSNKKI
jgi:hypothetical protein